MTLEERIENLKKQRKDRIEGNFNLIPFYKHFPRLSKSIPGLFRGVMCKILSPTG